MSGQAMRLSRLLGAAAAVFGGRYLRLGPSRRLIGRRLAIIAGGGIAALASTTVVAAATTEFMAEPISGKDGLKSKDMKARMEALIMQVQADFCRELEKEEADGALDEEPKKFKVFLTFIFKP